MLSRFLNKMRSSLYRRLRPAPVRSRHAEYSMLYSEDDALSRPSERLLDIAIKAADRARRTDLKDICKRLAGRFPYPDSIVDLWPGEHYRLLASIVQVLQPRLIVEIGTAEGLSALSMLKYMRAGGSLVTFDIVPWLQYDRSCLVADDFADGKLRQIIDDLGNREVFEQHRALLSQAELIFVDAAKDGVLEKRLISHLGMVNFSVKPVIVFDDIRLWNMLAIWRELAWPKLDLTSFGHWCGTGICEP